MPRYRRTRHDRPYYLIPIMLGMAGVLFSTQLGNTVLQGIVVLLCLAVPLFVGGHLLARIYSDGLQRFLLMAGMLTLTVGAAVTVSGLSDSLVSAEYVSEEVGEISSFLGMGSLLLGLLVVLYSAVRSGTLIDQLGDRFRHVADHMGEGFLMLDADGTVLVINTPFTEMTGIESDAVLGYKVQDLAKEYGLEPIFRHTERHDRGLPSEYEVDWTRDDETVRLLIRESPLFDLRKRRVGVLQTVHDITIEHRLKKRLEHYAEGLQKLVEDRTEKLRVSESRFRNLPVDMNEGFLTIDKAFTVRFANDRIQRLLRFDAGDLLGRDVFELIEISERDRLRAALAQVESGVPQRKDQDYTFVRSDGGYVPVKVSVAPIEDTTNDEMHLSLVVTDVRELKEMHHELELRAKELEIANEELRELDRAKDLFLSNVSHELRTPLLTVDGYIEMLCSEELGPVEPPQKAALDVMARNVDRLSSMINGMIDSSRMEIFGIRLFEVVFNPRQLLRECVDSAHPHMLRKDITLVMQPSHDVPFMWGDREKVGQAFGILLSNALKFSSEGSTIIVTIERRGASGAAIVVRDTGIGIAPEYHEQIFRKFYQVDSSLTRHYQGTGLGLSIAKGIMEAHGGLIELESEPGKGSSFTLLFPEALFDPREDSEESRSGERGSVYIANSFVEFRSALLHVLTRTGCRVWGFESGHECIRAAKEESPDIIVMDEALVDASVVRAFAQLKEACPQNEVPALLLLGRPQAEELGLEELGDNVSLLNKRFAVEQLLDRMRGMVHPALAEEASTDQGAQRSIG